MRRGVGDTQRIDTQASRSVVERSSPVTPSPASLGQDAPPPDKRTFHFPNEIIRGLYPTQEWRDQRNEPVQISFTEAQDVKCHCEKKLSGMTVRFNAIDALSILIIKRCNAKCVKIDNIYDAMDILTRTPY
jgi:hypothetical protein